MKLEDLEFQPAGCCGEYLNATVEISGGRKAIITKSDDDCYTLAVTKDGLLVGDVERMVPAARVDAVLTE